MDYIKLLADAARGAGIKVRSWSGHYATLDDGSEWVPLYDDGDALRLAVEIGACIQPKGLGVEVWVFEDRLSSGVIEYGDDPLAATRLAILKVAAARGRLL